MGLLLFSISAPDLPQFAGKAMAARALTYPLAALVIPALWWFRGRPSPYPHLVDALVVLPFLIDTGGNAADLYSVKHFDDLAHFVNWAILVTAFGAIMSALPIGRLNAAALAVGFGATTHVLWEVGEYAVMQLGSSGLQLTYEDTIGDLILSFCGSLVGALCTVTLLWRGRAWAGRLFGDRSPEVAPTSGRSAATSSR